MFSTLKSPYKSRVNVPFILIVLVSGVIAYSRPGRITIDLFCLLLIMSVLDTVHFFWMSRNTEIIMVSVPNKIEKRRQLELRIHIKNNSLWPIPRLHLILIDGYRLSLKEKQNYCLFMGGLSTKEIVLVYEAKLSGKQLVGVKQAFLQDYLGLYRKDLALPENLEIKVLPDIREDVEINDFLGKGTEEGYKKGYNHHQVKEEVAEDLAIYKEGDPLKLIHWKIFAQKEQLLVRQRETIEQKGEKITIILNPIGSKGEEISRYEAQDKTVTTSLSLCNQLVARGYQVGFMYYKNGHWMKVSLKSKRELHYLREKLGNYETIESENDKAYKTALKGFLKGIRMQQNFKLVVTEYIDEKLVALLEEEHKGLKDVQFICTKESIDKVNGLEVKIWGITERYRLKDYGKEG